MQLMPDTLAAAVCFLGAATAALLHTLPNINNCTTLCLPPPNPTVLHKTQTGCSVPAAVYVLSLPRMFCAPTGQKPGVEVQGEPREGVCLPVR